jgi:hypothetical protein
MMSRHMFRQTQTCCSASFILRVTAARPSQCGPYWRGVCPLTFLQEPHHIIFPHTLLGVVSSRDVDRFGQPHGQNSSRPSSLQSQDQGQDVNELLTISSMFWGPVAGRDGILGSVCTLACSMTDICLRSIYDT